MSVTCRSSPIKSKKISLNLNHLNLLHNGIKRKVSKQEYTKFFTKIKIGSRPKLQLSVPLNTIEAQTSIDNENQTMRQSIKSLQTENFDLKAKISKQRKLENMLMKKIQNEEIKQLRFQKALEIKLLVEAQFLQEKLIQKSFDFDRIRHQQQIKQKNINSHESGDSADLYAILNDRVKDTAYTLKIKQQILKKHQHQISQLRQNIQQTKAVKKSKKEQIRSLNMLIQKIKQHLPIESKLKEENQSGIFGNGSRIMVTSSLEKDIKTLHQQIFSVQKEIQLLMENKIKDKLSILKVINQIENQIIKIKHFEVRKIIKK